MRFSDGTTRRDRADASTRCEGNVLVSDMHGPSPPPIPDDHPDLAADVTQRDAQLGMSESGDRVLAFDAAQLCLN